MNRRSFIKQSGLFTAGLIAAPAMAKNAAFKPKIGLQLYSVRTIIAKIGLEKTIQQLQQIGYNSAELAGYSNGKFYDLKPKTLKSLIISHNMTVDSSHTYMTPQNAQEIIDATAETGCKYIVVPYLPYERRTSICKYKRLADELNIIGEKAKKSGMTLCYHNHAFEFEMKKGEIPYDVLLKRTDKDLVSFELDLYWVTRGGHDPVDYFNRYPQRFKIWHVKDMETADSMRFAPVGTGRIDFNRIFAHKNLAGMRNIFIEQDRFFIHEPMDAMKMSFDNLSKIV